MTAGPFLTSRFGRIRPAAVRVLAALGLANLCVVNLWYGDLVLRQSSLDYFRDAPACQTNTYATILLVAMLTAALLAAAWLVERSGRPLLKRIAIVFYILLFSYAIYPLQRTVLLSSLTPVAESILLSGLYLLHSVFLVLAILYAIRQSPAVFRAVLAVNLVLSPLFFVSLLDYGRWRLFHAPDAADFRPPTPARRVTVSHPASRRLLWVILDDWDYDVAFGRRPSRISLPECDRLRSESFFASEAYAPGEETLTSIPSLVSGLTFSSAEAGGTSLLWVRRAGTRARTPWSSNHTVFNELAQRGMRCAVAGCVHPYCRVFGDTLSRCTCSPLAITPLLIREAYASRAGAAGAAWHLFRMQLALHPLVPDDVAPSIDPPSQLEYIAAYGKIRKAALAYAADATLGFVFIHYPIPHPPGIYDPATASLATARSSYLGNLLLADRTLRELRASIQAAGLWDRTTLILSSDHPLRLWESKLLDPGAGLPQLPERRSGRIPFLVRFPGARDGVTYTARLETVLTHDIVLAIAAGEIATPGELARWLDARSSQSAGR